MHLYFSVMCKCGHKHEQENYNTVVPSDDEWEYKTHTTTSVTNAFGEMQFASSTAKAKQVVSLFIQFFIIIIFCCLYLAFVHDTDDSFTFSANMV